MLAVVLTVPVALLAMVSALQFGGWEWVALVLSAPVVFVSGLGFHRAALRERAPPRGVDGHAHLARDARGLAVVGGRARRAGSTRTSTSRSRPS